MIPSKHITAENTLEVKLFTTTKAQVFRDRSECISSECGGMCNNKQPTKERAADVIAAENRANGIRRRRDNQSEKGAEEYKSGERYNSCGGGGG